ncbi:MAG: hypothetical protein PWP27_1744 [Clostridiales bacterium]|nr:hypothetical protein [Clostridiales bacterium]
MKEGAIKMKHAIEGIYNEGKVIFNEQVPVKGKSKVLVVFLENYKDKIDRKQQLMNTFGSWEDDRDSEQIIQDIYSSRTSRKENISL